VLVAMGVPRLAEPEFEDDVLLGVAVRVDAQRVPSRKDRSGGAAVRSAAGSYFAVRRLAFQPHGLVFPPPRSPHCLEPRELFQAICGRPSSLHAGDGDTPRAS
jgi:hypothetical protein